MPEAFHIIHGDALTVLRTLPSESVHCCITSPPYWGLRDYGTAQWEGGDPGCSHTLARRNHPEAKQATQAGSSRDSFAGITGCRRCGATRVDQQIGLEPTPEAYVERLVEVFAEVRRVLRKDGTLWLNIGDSYARMQENNVPQSKNRECIPPSGTGRIKNAGLKAKDLVGIPWRVAFALQADGWYLRSDIIWSKPNPMPESVTDRPTKAHEYVFLLAKAERYWYDAEAIKEPRISGDMRKPYAPGVVDARGNGHDRGGGTIRKCLTDKQGELGKRTYTGFNARWDEAEQNGKAPLMRNRRSVWTLATLPTPDAHFATFPIELPETCMRAGCPEGGLVLDPFAGAGTVGMACLKNNRRFLGIELNAEYIEIAHNRARRHYPLFAQGLPA